MVDVEKQQINEKVLAVDRHMHLPTNEGEPSPELQKSLLQAIHQRLLDVAFKRWIGEVEEIKDVRIAGQLLSELGGA